MGSSQYNWVVVDELTLVCMLVHQLHSVCVALNTTGWMWTSSTWFVCLFMDYIQCWWLSIQLDGCGRAHLGFYACSSTTFSVCVALNTTGWMWTSSTWFVCLFIDYIQYGWLSIQLGGCGRAHLGLYACSSTTFSVGSSRYNWVCYRALAYHLGHSCAS